MQPTEAEIQSAKAAWIAKYPEKGLILMLAPGNPRSLYLPAYSGGEQACESFNWDELQSALNESALSHY